MRGRPAGRGRGSAIPAMLGRTEGILATARDRRPKIRRPGRTVLPYAVRSGRCRVASSGARRAPVRPPITRAAAPRAAASSCRAGDQPTAIAGSPRRPGRREHSAQFRRLRALAAATLAALVIVTIQPPAPGAVETPTASIAIVTPAVVAPTLTPVTTPTPIASPVAGESPVAAAPPATAEASALRPPAPARKRARTALRGRPRHRSRDGRARQALGLRRHRPAQPSTARASSPTPSAARASWRRSGGGRIAAAARCSAGPAPITSPGRSAAGRHRGLGQRRPRRDLPGERAGDQHAHVRRPGPRPAGAEHALHDVHQHRPLGHGPDVSGAAPRRSTTASARPRVPGGPRRGHGEGRRPPNGDRYPAQPPQRAAPDGRRLARPRARHATWACSAPRRTAPAGPGTGWSSGHGSAGSPAG